ncbi:TPA: hypothetical protein DEP96_03100 [Candidatus Uhrbacteria bacterium]|nr:hypothetical protein [Candidatus Uhrbacteria bacterium]
MDKTIHDVLLEYLEARAKVSSLAVLACHQDAVGLFEDYCDGYCTDFLEDEELETFERSEFKGERFTEYFSAEFLDGVFFADFISYFLPRKMLCGNDRIRRLARAILQCYSWCLENGHVKVDQDAPMTIN